MRLLVLTLMLLTACEPFQRTVLTISPARADGVDSVTARTLAIADDFARRYALSPVTTTGTSCNAAFYRGSYDLDPDPLSRHNVNLTLCVERMDTLRLRVSVREEITAKWGARGDSLRRELGDTLRARLGRGSVREG